MIWVKVFELIGGDPEGGAEVWLTDGTFECCCFAWPYYGKVGDLYEDTEPIGWLENDTVVRSDVKQPILTQLDGWDHFVVGKLVDKDNSIVQVGEFLFELKNSIPKDIQEGEYVEFKAYRPDIF